jgi:hypothetical protein
MTWQAGGVILGQVLKSAGDGIRSGGGKREATGGWMAGRQSAQKKAAKGPLRHSIRLRWTSREFDLDRVGFGQAIHF